MKRFIALILLAILALGTFGCAPKENKTDDSGSQETSSPLTDRERQMEEVTGD